MPGKKFWEFNVVLTLESGWGLVGIWLGVLSANAGIWLGKKFEDECV